MSDGKIDAFQSMAATRVRDSLIRMGGFSPAIKAVTHERYSLILAEYPAR